MTRRPTGGAIHLCGGDETPGPRGTDCPDPLHDHPLPAGYVDASAVAGRRLTARWVNRRCDRCGFYGWVPPVSATVSEVTAGWHPWSADHTDTWTARSARLWESEPHAMTDLSAAMTRAQDWLGGPAELGWDGLIWDGHHRLVVALGLGWSARSLPVVHRSRPCSDNEGAT